MFMKNIIQIWEENGRKAPFCVSKGNWADDSVYVIVEKVEPDCKGYGKAYGTPVTNGKINTYFDYDKKWKKEKLIPNPGVYNWKFRPDKEPVLTSNSKPNDESSNETKTPISSTTLGLNDSMNFGKFKGKTIGFLIENNKSYLSWALENVNRFILDDEAMSLLCKGD